MSAPGGWRVGDVVAGLYQVDEVAGQGGMGVVNRVPAASGAMSPAYGSPEQVTRRPVGRRSDLFSLGATVLEMFTGAGSPPRDFPDGHDSWQIVLQTRAVPIRSRNPALPPKLAQVIDHPLRDRPAMGFATAADFRAALATHGF